MGGSDGFGTFYKWFLLLFLLNGITRGYLLYSMKHLVWVHLTVLSKWVIYKKSMCVMFYHEYYFTTTIICITE